MTVSFVVFGIGVIAFGFALRAVLAGRAWIAAVVTGACTIGVAATPLHGWSGDEVHGTFAVIGYTAIVALPLLAAAPLAAAGRRGWARRVSGGGGDLGRVPGRDRVRNRARLVATPRAHGGRRLDRRHRVVPRRPSDGCSRPG